MALTYSKRLYLLLNKSSKKSVFLALMDKSQHPVPALHYSDSTDVSDIKMKKSVKIYLENAAKVDNFLKQQIKEFESGKEFLASMMGRKSNEMTQEDIDNAIEYLFPSSLYVPQSRPLLKPPEEIFGKMQIKEFDISGRPKHYLYYTLKPNFSQCLHDAAKTLQRLNDLLYEGKKPPKPLSLIGGKWLTQIELNDKFCERVFDIEYEKFLEVFNKLAEHPFAAEAEDFIKSYWKSISKKTQEQITPTIVNNDNVTVSVIEGARRKTSTARVSVSSPGNGKIRINNMGIDYFINIGPREQI